MNIRNKLICTVALIITAMGCTRNDIIELPLTYHQGYGYFKTSSGGISANSESEDNPWIKTYLNATGAPQQWTDVKYGSIETNSYQSSYQYYFENKITKEFFETLQSSWNWTPDTLTLTKEPLKTKIAFAYGTEPTGEKRMIVDANNNLDFSDDEIFSPISSSEYDKNADSVASQNSITVTYEGYVNKKKTTLQSQLLIIYYPDYNMFMCNFPQYATTKFKGETIAVCSDGFTELSYSHPQLTLISDTLKSGDKIKRSNYILKNEYIEIKGKVYKNMGVNTTRNTLVLQKTDKPKEEIFSTQTGYKAPLFEGRNFVNRQNISSETLKGKYVLLDFWAVWCGPCLQEIPNLNKLYESTDRERFEIISVVGDSTAEQLKAKMEEFQISWPQILAEPDKSINIDFGITGYPTTFLIDPQGVIIAKDLRGKDLQKEVSKLLAQ